MTPQQIDAMKMALEELAVRFSEGWHEGIKIDASDIMLLNEAAQALAQPEQEAVAWSHAGAMPPEQEVMKEAAYNLAPWLSAALDDPKVCKEYKDVINAWFDAAMPAPQRTQPEQEPVAWMDADGNVSDNNDHKCFPIPLYTKEQP